MRAAAIFVIAALASPALAQTIGPVNPGAVLETSDQRKATVNGTPGVRVSDTPGASQGYMVPDAKGGYVLYAPGAPLPPPPASRQDAEEIRLYVRELASQITKGISGDTPLAGVSSVPSAFVDQDTRAASPFGRLIGEQMTYELASRGFPVKEARGAAPVAARSKGKAKAPAENLAVLAGSYYVDKDNVFVNARLVEPSGRVLRTGSVLIPMTPTLRRMLGLAEPGGMKLVPPTLIGARDVNDPPGSGMREATPYSGPSKAGAKSSAPRKAAKPKAKAPCPPGCEPVDTAAKAQAAQPAQQPAQQPQQAPAQPKPGGQL